MVWRIFAASAIGKHHLDTGLPCQDAFAWSREGERVIAVVCDGAGSARHSDLGARTCADAIARHAAATTADLAAGIRAAVAAARVELEQLAEARSIELRDLACTVVGALLTDDGGCLFHLGDGLAVVEFTGADAFVSGPENGEYANETYFLTGEDWADHLRIDHLPAPAALLALMSDGAMPFVANHAATALFRPFLDPVARFLAGVDEPSGADALVATLADERTWSITGDDKTLLLAFWDES
jgi:hypothetical protein